MTVTTEAPNGPQISIAFAKELKRLASQVEKHCRNDDTLQMLSSLTAMDPIVKLLSKAALVCVTENNEVSSESELTTACEPSISGYL